jgi:hypothetical protein
MKAGADVRSLSNTVGLLAYSTARISRLVVLTLAKLCQTERRRARRKCFQ